MKYLITGASSGIGLEITKIICNYRNSFVVGVGRNEQKLKELEKKFNECFKSIVVDISSFQNIEIVVKEVSKLVDKLDVVINNAGFGFYKPILMHSDEEIVSMTMVNFVAPLVLTKKLIHLMNKNSIVVMIITAGIHVLMKNLPVYGATKIALHYAVEAFRYELKKYGIHLVAVYPGAIKTEFHIRAGKNIEKGVDVTTAAKIIVEAIEKKKKKVYIPTYLSILRILGPYLPLIY